MRDKRSSSIGLVIEKISTNSQPVGQSAIQPLLMVQSPNKPISQSPSRNMTYVVISPVRDEAAYIEKTLQSVIDQTIRPAEWVIRSCCGQTVAGVRWQVPGGIVPRHKLISA